jgi:addiction module RelE/StbE family toxin
MRRIGWSDEALANLDDIVEYIEAFNPRAAERLAERIIAAADGLRDFPYKGREAGNGVRQLALIYPYLIRYRVEGDDVIILRIRHGARQQD